MGVKMYDDNFELEIDSDFDFETEADAYETEVDNKVWINSLINNIDLGDLA